MDFPLTNSLKKEFWDCVHQRAVEFRNRKRKEIMNKENPTAFEIQLINSWEKE